MRALSTSLRGGLAALFLSLAWTVSAADSTLANDDEVRRQAREVQRLQEELQRAQSELDRLQGERAKTVQTPPSAATPASRADGLPIDQGEVVEAATLIEQFRGDPEGAAERYAKRKFRVRGTVAGFREPYLQSSYEVRLASTDPKLEVVCRFRYANRYRVVATRQKGTELIGRIDDRSSQLLFRKGETVVIEGKCQGRDEDEIRFTSCERTR